MFMKLSLAISASLCCCLCALDRGNDIASQYKPLSDEYVNTLVGDLVPATPECLAIGVKQSPGKTYCIRAAGGTACRQWTNVGGPGAYKCCGYTNPQNGQLIMQNNTWGDYTACTGQWGDVEDKDAEDDEKNYLINHNAPCSNSSTINGCWCGNNQMCFSTPFSWNCGKQPTRHYYSCSTAPTGQ